MDQQKSQSLSYERLINRAKYYKDKSLKLEKDYIFAKEKITWLETRLDKVINDEAFHDELNNKLQEKIAQLNDAYHKLEQDYHQEEERQHLKEQQYLRQISELKKQQEAPRIDQEKEHHYEHLLNEVQLEINEKNEQLEIYKKRLASLEKRLKSSGQLKMTTRPIFSDESQTDEDTRAIAYFDYALVVDKQKSVIRGDFTIENVGMKDIESPYICFRFYPADAAHLKGHFLSSHESQATDDSMKQWTFLDNEWANEAKERGEIWIHPISDFQLIPGEKVVINDFQIPVDTKLVDHITVESFIYSQSDNYRVKSVNQIIANF